MSILFNSFVSQSSSYRSSFETLPNDLIPRVLSYLELDDLYAFSRLNKNLKELWSSEEMQQACSPSSLFFVDFRNKTFYKLSRIFPSVSLIHCVAKDSFNRGVKKLLQLPNISNLQKLNFSNQEYFSSESLKHIQKIPLQTLILHNCFRVTNLGLKYIKEMPLQKLDVSGCYNIEDEGLKHLQSLPLKELSLEGCDRITDIGISCLNTSSLKYLNLSECEEITDISLINLQKTKKSLVFNHFLG